MAVGARGHEFTVSEVHEATDYKSGAGFTSEELVYPMGVFSKRLELAPERKFKVGDRIKVIRGPYSATGPGVIARVLTDGYHYKPDKNNSNWRLVFENEIELEDSVKVGDKVKATLGESVLVGEFYKESSAYFNIRPEGATDENYLRKQDGWKLEVVAPALPTGIGAVVHVDTDQVGYVWTRTSEKRWSSSYTGTSVDNAFLSNYKFTVLSEGVNV